MEYVILVDRDDNDMGLMEKMEAHRKGELHRAFSVFIFNDRGEMILQRRAMEKYHSPGLWTNACCSHPRKGETIEEAAHRRLIEEMGFDCMLEEQFSFVYISDVGQGLIEHEFDHVLIGKFNGVPELNPEEVMDWIARDPSEIEKDMELNPEKYTVWFRIAFAEAMKHFMNKGDSI